MKQLPKVYIMSPPWTEHSGGCTVLHKLCHLLNEKGVKTYLHPMFHGQPFISRNDWKVEFSTNVDKQNDIVIYPEGISGNPLGFKKVVRLVLNNPKPEERGYLPSDKLVYHHDFFYRYDFNMNTKKIVHLRDGSPQYKLHVIESRVDEFKDLGKYRMGTCYTMRKAGEKGYKPTHDLDMSIEIPDNARMQDLLQIFNTTKRFYCYDSCSYLSTIAALCGCESIAVPEPGLDKETWLDMCPGLRNGVAYGEDDLERALSTSGDYLRKYLQNLEDETDGQLDNIIKEVLYGDWSI
jgi:hypothetical protein